MNSRDDAVQLTFAWTNSISESMKAHVTVGRHHLSTPRLPNLQCLKIDGNARETVLGSSEQNLIAETPSINTMAQQHSPEGAYHLRCSVAEMGATLNTGVIQGSWRQCQRQFLYMAWPCSPPSATRHICVRGIQSVGRELQSLKMIMPTP
jgi:hypothetical protein